MTSLLGLPHEDSIEDLDSVVLTGPSRRASARRPVGLRRVIALIAVAALAIVLVVGLTGAVVSRRIAESQAVHDAAQLTDVLAASVITPALNDAAATDPTTATTDLDAVVRSGVLSDSLIRVKLWNPSGLVLYSDEPRLIGRAFDLDDEAREALTAPRTQAGVSDLTRPENEFERGQPKLLEVYRPVWTPDGQPLLFEAYFNYSVVSTRSDQLWRAFSGIMVSSLLALLVLLLPLVWALGSRIRQTRSEQEAATRRALDASDDERRRIAAFLHDGLAQQLAAASFAVAGQAEHAAAHGDSVRAAQLHDAAATVRGGIAGLRSVLVDIYPPNLRAAGLTATLHDLTTTFTSAGIEIESDIDPVAADALAGMSEEVFFRIAQEGLRNAARHSGAAHIGLRLVAIDDTTVRLDITDDGAGFSVAELVRDPPVGHFGIQLMRDAADTIDARLILSSGPGRGTRLTLEADRT